MTSSVPSTEARPTWGPGNCCHCHRGAPHTEAAHRQAIAAADEQCAATTRRGTRCTYDAIGGRAPRHCRIHLLLSERHGLRPIKFFGRPPSVCYQQALLDLDLWRWIVGIRATLATKRPRSAPSAFSSSSSI